MKNCLFKLQAIHTPRLLLRPMELSDSMPLHRAIEASRAELIRWMPWSLDQDFQKTKTFIEQAVLSRENNRFSSQVGFPLIILEKETQRIIGVSGYNEKSNPIRNTYDIGYWIHSEFVGLGHATETVNTLTCFTFQCLGATTLHISMQTTNSKSIAVATRAGYRRVNILKNHCVDCLTEKPADSYLYVAPKKTPHNTSGITWHFKEEADA